MARNPALGRISIHSPPPVSRRGAGTWVVVNGRWQFNDAAATIGDQTPLKLGAGVGAVALTYAGNPFGAPVAEARLALNVAEKREIIQLSAMMVEWDGTTKPAESLKAASLATRSYEARWDRCRFSWR